MRSALVNGRPDVMACRIWLCAAVFTYFPNCCGSDCHAPEECRAEQSDSEGFGLRVAAGCKERIARLPFDDSICSVRLPDSARSDFGFAL